MVKWINLNWNNIFVHILCCEKNWNCPPSASGCYGRQAGRQNMDEFEILKSSKSLSIVIFLCLILAQHYL